MVENHKTKRNILAACLVVSFAHFSLHSFVAKQQLLAYSELEFQNVDRVLHQKAPNPQKVKSASRISTFSSKAEYYLSFPLLIHDYPLQKDKAHYHYSSIPLWKNYANSFIASVIICLIALVLVRRLPEDDRFRKFFEGRDLHERDAIPKIFDLIPLLQTARWLERTEKTRYGLAIVIAFFHFFLTLASKFVAIAEQLNGPVGTLSLFAQIMRFPLTPILVSSNLWNMHNATPFIETIVSIANSLMVGVIVLIVIHVIRLIRSNVGTE